MGLLDSFEKGLERAVNGAFAKTFRSGLQPIEIAAAVRRELDTKAVVVSRERILVPNRFDIALETSDFARLNALGATLIDELTQLTQQHAAHQGYAFAGPVLLGLVEDPTQSLGMVSVSSKNVEGTVNWAPVLEIGGTRHPITRSRTIVGRGSEADITVDDPGISRKHIEILWNGTRAQVNDLGSTNGSQLDGRPVRSALLEPDSVVSIGRTRIVYRVVPHAAPTEHTKRREGDHTTIIDNFWGQA